MPVVEDHTFIPHSAATPYRSLQERMSEFLPSRDDRYTDSDIQQISNLLEHMNCISWSKVPRIYTVLRRIGQLQLLDAFIAQGITDIWFPFSNTSLPQLLSPSFRSEFLQVQSVVLTKAIDLEKGELGQHRYFGEGEPLPFKVLGILGKGGYGQVDKVLSLTSYNEYALKRVRRRKFFTQAKERMKDFERELEVLKRLKHQHTVVFIGSYTDPLYLGLIMSPVADSFSFT
jgi:hypothetical protein